MVSVDPEDVAVFIPESVVRGHHIYKEAWTPSAGEVLLVQQEPENPHNRCAVCILKSSTIVGHVPRELSQVFWFFLSHGGTNSCEITGHRKCGSSMSVQVYRTQRKFFRRLVKVVGMVKINHSQFKLACVAFSGPLFTC